GAQGSSVGRFPQAQLGRGSDHVHLLAEVGFDGGGEGCGVAGVTGLARIVSVITVIPVVTVVTVLLALFTDLQCQGPIGGDGGGDLAVGDGGPTGTGDVVVGAVGQ